MAEPVRPKRTRLLMTDSGGRSLSRMRPVDDVRTGLTGIPAPEITGRRS